MLIFHQLQVKFAGTAHIKLLIRYFFLFLFSSQKSVVLFFFFKLIVTPARTNPPMADLCRSLTFSSDQLLCNADILSSSEAIARIEVAVLNFLRILNSSSPAISDLPLVCCSFFSEALHLIYRCSNSKDFVFR